MRIDQNELPKKYHQAVEKWQRRHFPDLDILERYWAKFFPGQEPFCLCAKHDLDTSDKVVVGKRKGEDKMNRCEDMEPEEARRLLQIIKAQASTEFGSVQQHQGSIDKAQDDSEKFAIMRVMAEELRHGYQMFHLLVSDRWRDVGGQDPDEVIEEVLSMGTGSHVLGAFNIEYDCFVDNIVFAAVIDRVGKYQLTMQKVCAYKPMAASMTPMLEEEAFHLVAGVFPLRRWVRRAARDESVIGIPAIQRYLNKWIPRGYEMFGHEKGGHTNIEMGFKDMTNARAVNQYEAELQRMVRDLNRNYVRARLPEADDRQAFGLVDFLVEHKESKQGISHEDLLAVPHQQYFRRRGLHAMQLWGVQGQPFETPHRYKQHLQETLPEPYMAHRDFAFYLELLEQVQQGTLDAEEAARQTPRLTRTSYCPCSKSVRWILEEEAPSEG